MSDWDDPRSPWYVFNWTREAEGLADELEHEGPHAWCCDDLAAAVLVNGGVYEKEEDAQRFKDMVNDLLEERRGYSPEDEDEADDDAA